MPNLARLPEELINEICQDVEALDVSSLRLTCRSLKDKSYHQFATKFFSKREFLLTRKSLDALLYISKHEKFSRSVRSVFFSSASFPHEFIKYITEHASDDESIDNMETASNPPEVQKKKVRRGQRRAYARLMHEQNTLRRKSSAVATIDLIFKNLPSLEVIGVTGYLNPRSPPWGARAYRREIGCFPPTPQELSSFRYSYNYGDLRLASHRASTWTFAVIISAIASSGIQPKTLYYETAYFRYPGSLPKTASSRSRCFIPAQTLSEEHFDSLRLAFVGLKTLVIDSDWGLRHLSDNSNYYSYLRRFLILCPFLEDFTYDGVNQPNDVELWRGFISDEGSLQKIRSLYLSNTRIQLEDLNMLLRKCSETLEKFCMSNVDLNAEIPSSFKLPRVLRMLRVCPKAICASFVDSGFKSERYRNRERLNLEPSWDLRIMADTHEEFLRTVDPALEEHAKHYPLTSPI